MTDAMPYHSAKRIKTEGEDRNYSQAGGYYSGSGRGSSYHSGSGDNGRSFNHRNDDRENHVLLVTVLNPAYPITSDVIFQICNPHGKVLRVVIFKKNGVQAMVEFDSIDSAKRAKTNLHGCDIYSGCCTLRIEYAKPARLNVYKNDNESYDFTNPNPGKQDGSGGGGGGGSGGGNSGVSGRNALLNEPSSMGMPPGQPSSRPSLHPNPHSALGNNNSVLGVGVTGGNDYRDTNYASGYQTPRSDTFGDSFIAGGNDIYSERGSPMGLNNGFQSSAGSITGSGQPAQHPQQGSVMMVYGLEHTIMNSERLFNLYCLYGNVVRVKFLKSKEGCAMVQMGDPTAVEKCVQALNNCLFFGKKMQLGYSKQAFLNDVQQPFDLHDGTPSFKDFMGNRNNRFTNPEATQKNRISPPAKVLHFFNAPFGLSDEDIMSIFRDNGAPSPTGVKLFQSKTERSSSGLIQFESLQEAVEALVLCNHVNIPNPTGKFPYVFKLCFSSSMGSRF